MNTTQTSAEELITVCSSCLCASCWQYIFICENYKHASTVQKTRAELATLNREHSCYWKTDEELAAE